MLKDLFHKKNQYIQTDVTQIKRDVPDDLITKCKNCNKLLYTKEIEKNQNICPNCEFHFSMNGRERTNWLFDEETFIEENAHLHSKNPLNYPGYEGKIKQAQEKTNTSEGILTGVGKINGNDVAIGVMESQFIMGSMGSVVGEKIARITEIANEKRIPLILFCASGGARMQEGAISLMQMAKTSAAIARFQSEGGFYLSILTNPTFGGVTASFAMLGDIIYAEPGALIGFAGRRVVEQTIRQKLPDDFQTAEFQLKHGQIDGIAHRKNLRQTITQLIELHQKVEK